MNLKVLHGKGNHEQDEKTTFEMGENIWKLSNWWVIRLQNFPTPQTAQLKKNYPIKKWAGDLNKHFSKENKQVAKRHMRRYSKPPNY